MLGQRRRLMINESTDLVLLGFEELHLSANTNGTGIADKSDNSIELCAFDKSQNIFLQ